MPVALFLLFCDFRFIWCKCVISLAGYYYFTYYIVYKFVLIYENISCKCVISLAGYYYYTYYSVYKLVLIYENIS